MNPDVYIFLDFDGVLATDTQYFTNRKKWHPMYDCYRFDEKCVRVFNQIIEKLVAAGHKPVIVVSSDWKTRYSIDQLNQIFEWNKVNGVVADVTPTFWKVKYFSLQQLEVCRADEIKEYVLDHNIRRYLAIDDLDLSPWIPDNFVRTPSSLEGIKQSGVKDKILKKLLI
jgi:hypothetical protein